MREIVFDTETTGLNPHAGDRIIEIGCVELVNRCETGRTFHAYFNPGRSIPPEAVAVHGLNDSFLADKPFFADQLRALLAFIDEDPLIAHNAEFDFGFVNMELRLCGKVHLSPARMICTQALARQRHPGAKHTLDALCTRYGIDRSQRVKHGALIDAQLTAQLYVELSGGRQIGFMLPPEREAGVAAAARTTERPFRAPRPHAPSEAELVRHAAFLASITAPLWRDPPPAH